MQNNCNYALPKMSNAPLREVYQNGIMPTLDSSVAEVSNVCQQVRGLVTSASRKGVLQLPQRAVVMKSNLLISVFSLFLAYFSHATELREREELFARRPIGTYRIHATTDAVVSGKGKVDLLICQPYPESSKYQDVKWLKEVPVNLQATYPETGHPYVRFAERVSAPTTINIDRDYVVTLYDVRFDWSSVTILHPYDKTSDEYVRYTRRYPCDISDTNAYEECYSWVTETSKKIKKNATNDLDYVRRVYSAVTAEFTYGDWPGGFTNLIARKQGDCGGITRAFVCLLREGGIPARAMVCLRPDESPHVWPEFYLQDYGWIPTDPTFDLGKSSNPENFGVRSDNTIVMTYDMGFTVQTAGGIVNRNVFIQGLAWWWYWWWENPDETQRDVRLKTGWEYFPGMLTEEGVFVSSEDLWNRVDTYGIKPHVGFVFDGNYRNIGTHDFTLWNGQNCSYVKSPLGYALRLDHDDGAWTSDDLGFGDQWTILTIARLPYVENVPLFCIGSSWGGNTGFVLASGKTNEVTLSFWEDSSSHLDLLAVFVPDSASKYHSYALRVDGLDVSLFVDGVCAGKSEFPVSPQSNGLQFHSVYGGVCNSGMVSAPGGCVEDWRLYNSLVPDEMIMTYADVLLKYDENRAGEIVEGNVIPHYWIYRNCPNVSTYGNACLQMQRNGYRLWECYVAGLNPLDSQTKFSVDIRISNGKPHVFVNPYLGNARKYTILESSNLLDWHETEDMVGPFFKVKVGLP